MILDGSKTVELRKGWLDMIYPSRLWIYVPSPVKQLQARATISEIEYAGPDYIWAHHKEKMGLNYKEFKEYIDSRKKKGLTAIILSNVKIFERPVPLDKLREYDPPISPPQFYTDLGKDRLWKDHCRLLAIQFKGQQHVR